jgi:hypothetical protein
MITWISLTMLFYCTIIVRACCRQDLDRLNMCVAVIVAIVTTLAPTIFMVGWVLLPAYGVGPAIIKCYGG